MTTTSKNTFIEFHVLRSFAPGNLNRDEFGTPKTANFGDARRLRISSQCLKRTWRMSPWFRGEFAEAELGVRTSRVADEVMANLKEMLGGKALSPKEETAVAAFLQAIGKKARSTASGEAEGADDEEGDEEAEEAAADSDKATESVETAHLLFLSHDEIKQLAAFIMGNREKLEKAVKEKKKQLTVDADQIKKLKEALRKHLDEVCDRNAVDVALFGRFVTGQKETDLEARLTTNAALQVAHALGTQKVDVEFDYFSAVDDVTKGSGAGHIGETEFASSVFYVYAACDVAQLVQNLGGGKDAAPRAIRAVAHAMMRAVPTGKINGTAPHNPADFIEIIFRSDPPISLANAFRKPVRAHEGKDVLEESLVRYAEWRTNYDEGYGKPRDGATFRFKLGDKGKDGKSAIEVVLEAAQKETEKRIKALPADKASR